MIELLNITAIVGLAWGLAVFGIQHKLRKPFSCELCLTFHLSLIMMVFSAIGISVDITPFNALLVLKLIYIIETRNNKNYH